jgi:hypothetical protein
MNRRRVVLHSVNVSAGSGSTGVSVVLRSGGDDAVGAAAGLSGNVASTTARATLRAVDGFTEHSLVLRGATQTMVGELSVMLVAVTAGSETLVGVAAIASRSVPEAASRATLDAINRLVSTPLDGVERARHEAVYNLRTAESSDSVDPTSGQDDRAE